MEDELLETLEKREVHIAIRRDNVIGSGTADDPYDGSTSIKLVFILQFSKDAKPNTRFIFGPGIFRTQGGPRNAVGGFDFVPLPGQEYIGAGIYATTLRLELASTLYNGGY